MTDYEKHRQRQKAKFISHGLRTFEEYEVLELLLFYAIPRKDTKPMAKALLKRFGSIAKVINAPEDEIKEIDGLGDNAATFLRLLREFDSYLHIRRKCNVKILNDINEIGSYMAPFFYGIDVETVYMLSLDAKCQVISCREVCKGNVNTVAISIRKIVDIALREKATTVILAHNHPGGLAIPSSEDVQTTNRLAIALQQVDVLLADHLIVGDDDEYVSLVHSGLYKPTLTYKAL